MCIWTLCRCWLSLHAICALCTKVRRLNARRQLLVALAEWLCAHHRRDARAGRIVADMHLHLLPTMNPDGYACPFVFTRVSVAQYNRRKSFYIGEPTWSGRLDTTFTVMLTLHG